MLGPFLLVAPITEEGASSREVTLPAGRWFDLRSGAIWEGPATVELGGTLAAMPVLAREGTILPRWSSPGPHAAADHGVLVLDVVPGPEPTEITLADWGEGGVLWQRRIALQRTSTGIALDVLRREELHPIANTRPVIVRVVRVDAPVGSVSVGPAMLGPASSREAIFTGRDFGYFHDRNERALYVRLDVLDTADTTIETRATATKAPTDQLRRR